MVVVNSNAMPIPLLCNSFRPDTHGTVAAYGKIDSNSNEYAPSKQIADFVTIPDTTCLRDNPLKLVRMNSRCLVGSPVSIPRPAICYGDSGAAFIKITNQVRAVVGLISFGAQQEPLIPACKPELGTGFVYFYPCFKDFIEKSTGVIYCPEIPPLYKLMCAATLA